MNLTLSKVKAVAIVWILLVTSLLGSSWYVRPARTGNGTGADWNNAWALSGVVWSSVKAGDTVWVAGGTYSSALSPSSGGSTGGPVTIARVQASDTVPVKSPGWQAGFDSQAVIGGVYIPKASHIIVDGRSAYGFLINIGMGGGNGIEIGQTGNSNGDLKFYYVDILGPYGSPSKKTASEVVGWKMSPSTGTLSDITFNHCRVRGVGLGSHVLATNVTIEYCIIGDVRSDDGIEHPDVMYCYPSPNMTWRYNTVFNCDVDGIFFEYGGAVNFKFYGNTVYNTHNHNLYFKDGNTYGPVYIFNNVFAAPSANDYGYCHLATPAPGSQVYNNVFFNVSNDLRTTSDYNAYNYQTLNGYKWNSGEAHSYTFTGSPFVNITTGDSHQSGAGSALKDKGKALTADGFVNKDPDGKVRGADGMWDIGPYEYSTGGSSSPSPTPSATPSATPTPTPSTTPSPTPTPPPTPTPTATPIPTATPVQNKFKVGDMVTATAPVNVRDNPAGNLTGTHAVGPVGKVTGGPVTKVLYTAPVNWYFIQATKGKSGWIGDDDLTLSK